jgi:indole-3-glycerol phosphate synthase
VETHNQDEVERAISSQAKIIGINNRDLTTFTIDINTTQRLLPLIPQGRIIVSESGITSRSDVEKLKGWGVNAVLVGEALVTADDITAKIRELII